MDYFNLIDDGNEEDKPYGEISAFPMVEDPQEIKANANRSLASPMDLNSMNQMMNQFKTEGSVTPLNPGFVPNDLGELSRLYSERMQSPPTKPGIPSLVKAKIQAKKRPSLPPKMPPANSAPMPPIADPIPSEATSNPPVDLSSIPDMNSLIPQAGDDDEFLKAAIAANSAANLGQAANPIALGTNKPISSDALYNNMAHQTAGYLQYQQNQNAQQNRIKQAILSAIQNRGLLNSKIALAQQIANTKAQATKDAAKIRADALQNNPNLGFRQGKETQRRFDALNKGLTEELATGNSPVAIAARSKQSIANLKAMVNGVQNPDDLNPQQVFEASKTLDRILSGGNPTAYSTGHLTPNNSASWLADKMQWITNQPRGAGQGEFINQIMHTLDRENDLANQTIQSSKKKLLAPNMDLEQTDPDKWARILKTHGLDDQSLTPQQQQPKSNKVKVSNGKETFLIDPSDLDDARADGYEVLK